ncbi:hypothetical protein [Runella slithyformis]|uniref:Uncharacterized protein n=1 Tax=Runella slithyformis (strain ATCC 29530 / DSM 19594 / LMG 11500 / NCIMB 11436 / LSU 4) TaxID=761193 RepID=A0A7U3ZKK0_RUNSL|nr:hypothetical protein [Runella slithyformis]AEI48876.1 hypothetical protein Runsl_2471 [Runella slithyformis DSM 19594]
MKKKIRIIAPLFFVFLLGLVFEQAKTKGIVWYIILFIVAFVWIIVGNKIYNTED